MDGFKFDPVLDSGDAQLNVLRACRGLDRLARQHLFDLPDTYVLGRVVGNDGDIVAEFTVGWLMRGLIEGGLEPELVLELISCSGGAVRPVDMGEEGP